ncbi:MAG: hypothetical protein KDA31_04440 [Phycisphaerales bacterium]|nr:hypothetical protein [Phycisphaerales bacterium]MCB9835729.1 hypothetical protein [Phycisphaera sp.]
MSSYAPSTTRLWRFFFAMLIGLGFASVASADIAQVNSLLARAETNLQSVSGSLGNRTSWPGGSSGKLLARRLEQALDDINPAKELLEKVPAGTAGRDEAVARYQAAAAEYNRLREIMVGPDAPAPTEPAGGVKLDYQQEDVLKGAKFNLREVEANAEQLTKALETLREVEDQLTIDYREVDGLMGVVENAKRKAGFVKDALDKLPADGRGVPEVRQQLVNAEAKIVTATDFLRPVNEKLRKLIDPAQYPEFDADRKRLRELSVMFNDTMILQTDRPRAAETLAQADAARDECIRIAQKYARLMQQRTDQGRTIEGVGNGFLSNLNDFLAEAEAQKAVLPDEIREDLKTAMGYAAEAVKEQKPLWFTGGIPQTMGFAEDRLALLSALDEEAGKELRAEYEATQEQLKEQAESLSELIIRENKLPKDAFAGDDREEAIKTAVSAWKVQQEEFEVLAVRIPGEQWARETKWTYSNGTWYFSDRSKLQVRLIVADHENPDLAIDRPINIWKDHQKGDSMIGVPLYGFEDELQPSSYLLKSNVKKP